MAERIALWLRQKPVDAEQVGAGGGDGRRTRGGTVNRREKVSHFLRGTDDLCRCEDWEGPGKHPRVKAAHV